MNQQAGVGSVDTEFIERMRGANLELGWGGDMYSCGRSEDNLEKLDSLFPPLPK